MRFKDKVAIITGGASGIGLSTAKHFSLEGAKVVIVDKDRPAGIRAARQIRSRKSDVIFLKADISREESVKQVVKRVIKKYKRVDVLVNNAAKFIFKGVDATVAEFQESLDTNVIGHHLMTKYVSAEMKKTGGGSIVFVGSISSVIAQPNLLTYNAAKGAILQMTRCYALDLAPDIRVNCLCPGHVWTPAIPPIAKKAGKTVEAFEEERRQSTLLKRVADPSEIAKPILFLASEDASYITGAILMVDAGYTTV